MSIKNKILKLPLYINKKLDDYQERQWIKNKEKREREQASLASIKMFLLIGKNYLIHFLIWITKYPPFTLISHLTWMTNENKETFQARIAVRDTGFRTGEYYRVKIFYSDDYFVCFKGNFRKSVRKVTKNKFIKNLEKIYGKGTVYLSDIDEKYQLLRVNKEAVSKRPYYSFFQER